MKIKLLPLSVILLLCFISASAQEIDKNEDLLIAAYDGDYSKVDSLIEAGADVNYLNKDGVSALMFSAQAGKINVAELLIANGAMIDTFPWDGRTALIAAVRSGQFDMTEFLIRNGANVNVKDIYKSSPLHYAAANFDYYMSDMLLYYDADIESKDKHGNTPLLIASFFGTDSLINLLIDHNCNINAQDSIGNSALIKACENDLPETVELLIEKGADLNLKNKKSYTALQVASMNGYEDIVELLIENKADLNIQNKDSLSAIRLAILNGQRNTKKLLKKAGAKYSYKPALNILTLGFDNSFSDNDYFMGAHAGITESALNITLNIAYMGRIGHTSVFTNTGEDIINQYWEKRHILSLGLEKNIAMEINSKSEKGIYLGLKEIYTFGKYKGSTQKAKLEFITSPELGIYLSSNIFTIKAAYQYCNFNIDYLSPNRFNISLLMNINFYNNSYIYTEPYWIY